MPATLAQGIAFSGSRYIEKPLLIGGRKFDLRLYVLVTSYRPLKAYMSIEGFARLCSDRYDNSGADLDNRMVHLTNASVQRHNESYNTSHGNKWPLDSLRLYLESTRGKSETDKLFARIRELVVVSLRACSGVIVQDRCVFFCSAGVLLRHQEDVNAHMLLFNNCVFFLLIAGIASSCMGLT